MQYRHEIGHALANLAFAAVLTSSFALLAFSKYRRAQIALFHVYTASVASIIDFYSHSLRRLLVSFSGLRLSPLRDSYSIRAVLGSLQPLCIILSLAILNRKIYHFCFFILFPLLPYSSLPDSFLLLRDLSFFQRTLGQHLS